MAGGAGASWGAEAGGLGLGEVGEMGAGLGAVFGEGAAAALWGALAGDDDFVEGGRSLAQKSAQSRVLVR
eukprot:7008201-Prymnesium_polylepis.1